MVGRGRFPSARRKELGGSWAGAMQWCSGPQLMARVFGVRRGQAVPESGSPASGARVRCESLLRARWGGNTANYRISNVLLFADVGLRQCNHVHCNVPQQMS